MAKENHKMNGFLHVCPKIQCEALTVPVNWDSGISGTDKGFVQLGPNTRNPSLIWIVEFEEKNKLEGNLDVLNLKGKIGLRN